jgi:uncharacterized membrane protein
LGVGESVARRPGEHPEARPPRRAVPPAGGQPHHRRDVPQLVGVVFALLRSQQKDPVGAAAAILAVVGVVAAWALVNTVYAFKYARMYYHDERHRFQFNQDEDPSYSDFAYAAFSIGMAYNASNVNQSSTPSRRIALGHALLAYFFGTFVVAVAINLLISLTQSR